MLSTCVLAAVARRVPATRDLNRHIAFGFRAHYCLGTHLARLETRAFSNELIPRLEHAELAGTPELTRSLHFRAARTVPDRGTTG